MAASHENLQLISLLEMKDQKAQDFSHKVRSSRGVVPIYIHPYYDEQKAPYKNKAEQIQYHRQRDHEISTFLRTNKPLVIFEEAGRENELQNRIEAPHKTNLFVVKTIPGSSEPINTNWDEIGQILHESNAQQLTLGGVFSSFCVYSAGANLHRQGFKVVFPFPLATFDGKY